MKESTIQARLFKWANSQLGVMPELTMMFSIQNESMTSNKITGVIRKRMGRKAGVPDVFLAYPNEQFSGLFIELKTEKGKTSPKQDMWLRNLSRVGYKTCVCHSIEEAKSKIQEYLK